MDFNIGSLIGNTPLIEYEKTQDYTIFAKCEFLNPGGSIKDRPVYAMINHALKNEIINENSTIIEATSGNTGIALAMICANFGLKLTLVMPENMSKERIEIFKAYGANIVLTPAELGMAGSVEECKNLKKHTSNSYMLDQFNNPLNPLSQEETAQEIIQKITSLDYFICGFGTGGSISGISKVLKNSFPDVKIIAIEPKSSPLLSRGISGIHKITGIGANFIPNNLNQKIIDDILLVSDEDAINQTKELAKSGLFVGISSGANIFGAKEIAKKEKASVLTLLVDRGDRYLSTNIFND